VCQSLPASPAGSASSSAPRAATSSHTPRPPPSPVLLPTPLRAPRAAEVVDELLMGMRRSRYHLYHWYNLAGYGDGSPLRGGSGTGCSAVRGARPCKGCPSRACGGCRRPGHIQVVCLTKERGAPHAGTMTHGCGRFEGRQRHAEEGSGCQSR
jgi:hypothetical protein